MNLAVDRASDGSLNRYRTALPVGLGLLLGALARDLPSVTAALIFPGTGPRECGDRSIAECAVAAVPQAIGDIVLFGVVVLAVTVLCAALGVALLVLGLRNDFPVTHSDPATTHGTSSRSTTRFGCVAIGTSLLVPALWLVATTSGLV